MYRRYVEQGPYVPWAENFGQQCEEPDFAAANQRYVTEAVDNVRSDLRPYKRVLQVGGLLLVGVAGLLLLRRRRQAS
ncbi:hypothetical protein D3C76_1533560 [compost metagenome]